jgi:hypothetical protein
VSARGSVDWWLATFPLDGRIARARIRYSHHVLVRVTTDDGCGFGAAALYARAPHQVRALRPRLADLALRLPYDEPVEAREMAAGLLGCFSDVRSALRSPSRRFRSPSSCSSMLPSARNKRSQPR